MTFFKSPRYATVRFLLLAFFLWRGALFAVNFASLYAAPQRNYLPAKDYTAFPKSRFLDSFVMWDSGWYQKIAERGYYLEGAQSDVAFFPAYPYLARWLGKIVGSHWTAGLLISNFALLGALFYIYGIARRYLDEDRARQAAVFVLVFPTSFFFSTYYAESLALLATAAALYHYEHDQLLAAGAFGGLAALTRSAGVLLFPALLAGALHRRGWSLRRLTPRMFYLLLIPAAFAAFMWILAVQVGDPLAFAKAQGGWHRAAAFPLFTIFKDAKSIDWGFPVTDYRQVFLVIDLLATLGIFWAAAASLRRLDLAHSVYAVLAVVFPLASGRVLSMLRFASCVVPIFVLLAMAAKRPWVDRFMNYAMGLVSALTAFFFSHWHWAG